jgi:hypothetical protein
MRPLPQHWRIDGSEGEATARSIAWAAETLTADERAAAIDAIFDALAEEVPA